ncbi:molybdenum cofactor guanylyltransferase [Clostridium lacusfryxellense]|uniref:molybdenum cofactor guanylyltransferase n=1 Tax=Clostridium lacusfryxellense TaxID=205328 RepID=UPI001C0E69BF|nr:molybdenum cofactor guanylyltransferase [Clostridium lacusfryxellense]MBU3109967.1 molybdenum cofactor guanylyltransferase [Clostridium lacusfryxellense]
MNKFNTAVILAGGKSSRMGFDKQFLEINKKRLIDEQVLKLREHFEEIIVVSNKIDSYYDVNYKLVCDEIKDIGPLGGLHIGLKNASSKYTYITACDMPIINNDYIKFMKEKINDNVEACVTKTGNRVEPFNGFYSTNLIHKIEELIYKKRTSMLSLLRNINTIYIDEEEAKKISGSLDMFINLNDTQDLESYINYAQDN